MTLDDIAAGSRVLLDANVWLTNDSLLLATGLRAGVSQLATADPQFDAVTGVTVFKPDDVV